MEVLLCQEVEKEVKNMLVNKRIINRMAGYRGNLKMTQKKWLTI